ncbi:malonyl-ACP O-methyltransferase BioC [Thioalbus denitrificans]|uniref:Malonyl-[acyl-carrier protein] O-methyltransferase n=1 Tax=Thioalbus denitrificans TaxID=547122 RepID=A0A369CGL7_9GAMM|nr:malonyl-ACP O-methyltransferase BioC [Thioalbus denitrificans]RCX33222.1 malonyl-CoA O-methyltransferase [Thioalbus denitrificans]
MDKGPVAPIDKRLVAGAFSAAAARYDEAAQLQREVGDRLLERLELVRIDPRRILDVGAGTGRYSERLGRRYRRARVVSLDIAPGMLAVARSRTGWFARRSFLCADAECLPLADASVELLFSNLTLQWCTDLDRTFAEFRRVLRPGGLLMFSTLGPDTLKELRASWRAVDGGVHVNTFADMHDVGDAMVRARLAGTVLDMEYFTLTYPQVDGLMRDLKVLGAHNVNRGRSRGLTGPGRVRALRQAYERFRTPGGLLPATYEVVYGHAWAPEADARPQPRGPAGEVHVPFPAWRRPGTRG